MNQLKPRDSASEIMTLRYARSDLNNASLGLFLVSGFASAIAAFVLAQDILGSVIIIALLIISWLADRKLINPFTVSFRRLKNALQLKKSFLKVPYATRSIPFNHLTTTSNDIVLHDGRHTSVVNVTDSLEVDKVDIAISGSCVDAFQVIGEPHSIHQDILYLISNG